MGQIVATVRDAVDTRVFECLLPDDEELESLAQRLADTLRFVVVGSDNYPLNYAFLSTRGTLLDARATFGELKIDGPLDLRLVPELCAASETQDADVKVVRPPTVQRTMLGEISATETTPTEELTSYSSLDVRIDAGVHKDIEKFARRDLRTECAGLLLGNVTCEGREKVVHIVAAIPSFDAIGTRTNVRIGFKAWESMHRIRDHKFQELRIIGWFHTHAGWGVFMSDSDITVHKAVFAHPDMVAYVLDPSLGRDGFYYWKSGRLTGCNSFGLVCTPQSKQERKHYGKRLGWLCKSLIGVAIASCICYGLSKVDINAINPFKAAVTEISTPAKVVVSKPVETDITITLAGGETLSSIARKYYGKSTLAPSIARYNKISNRNRIGVGQQIRLPSRETLDKLRRK